MSDRRSRVTLTQSAKLMDARFRIMKQPPADQKR
jgi:hypothetical protein